MIAREIVNGGMRTIWLWCPGCEILHSVRISSGTGQPCWTFNGNLESPTFSPSLLVRTGHHATNGSEADCEHCAEDSRDGETRRSCIRCHSFIVDGQWQFLSDCAHHLAGQTVPLPELPRPWNGEPDPEDLKLGIHRGHLRD